MAKSVRPGYYFYISEDEASIIYNLLKIHQGNETLQVILWSLIGTKSRDELNMVANRFREKLIKNGIIK